jgi:prepilin-type N-terminal cleavage/methylation domain-containing protein
MLPADQLCIENRCGGPKTCFQSLQFARRCDDIRSSMSQKRTRIAAENGFTLIELMIVVTLIGVIASIAIPLFSRYQLRARSAEVKSNLATIRVAEEAFFSGAGIYLAANAEPVLIPGAIPGIFDSVASDFFEIGWAPEGLVYFSYAVTVTPSGTGYTVDAGADIDADGVIQLWGYAHPDVLGTIIDGGIGCEVAQLAPNSLSSCHLGNGIF